MGKANNIRTFAKPTKVNSEETYSSVDTVEQQGKCS